jgi:predicted dehydrogenase
MHLTAGKWRQKPALSGGGQLYDSTCHVLSAMMYLVNSPVKEVCCWTDYKGREVDINAVGMIRFANGCMATITSGGNCPTWKSHLIFQGDNAIMEISPHGGDFRVHGESFKQEIVGVPRGWKIKTVFPIQNFAQVIQKKAAIRCGGEVGILMADLMDGLYASARGGKPVRLRSRAAT